MQWDIPRGSVLRAVTVRLAAGQAQEAEAIAEAARRIFPTIPGVTGFQALVGLDPHDLLLHVAFAAAEDVEPYRAHPIHTQFVQEWLQPRMERLDARNYHA